MAYFFQSYIFKQLYTSAAANQTEVNVRDHVHGSDGVAIVLDSGLSANVPLKNLINIFSQNQVIQKTFPALTLINNTSPVDSRRWSIDNFNEKIRFITENDDGSSGVSRFEFSRNGIMTAGSIPPERLTAGTSTGSIRFNGGIGINIAPPSIGRLQTSGDIITGGVFRGGTLAATLLSAGTIPLGVNIPTTQLNAGALPTGVTIDAARISGGTVASPVVVPLGRMVRGEFSALGSAITITSSNTIMIALNLGTVAIGDRVLFTTSVSGGKGATAGQTRHAVIKSAGSAGIIFQNNLSSANGMNYLAAFDFLVQDLSGVLRVTSAGTLTLAVSASSVGSNTSGAVAQIYALILRDS